MNINFETFKKVIPNDDSPPSKSQRQKIWELCDKNQNGFVSLKDVQQQLCRYLNVEPTNNMNYIIQKSYEDVRNKLQTAATFGKNIIQKKQFKLFVNFLHKHLTSLKVFESFDKDGSNSIQQPQFLAATKLLTKWDVNEQKKSEAKKLILQKKLTFNKFQEWLDTFDYYDVKDVQKIKR